MKKQTAVEWLFEQLTSTWYDTNSSQDILKQAKAMEKEQFIENFINGSHYSLYRCNISINIIAEQFYNEIYTDGTI
jgi:hypothetical protein